MNNTWKLSILSGAVLLASGAFAAAGCTVTTTSSDNDGGTFTGNDAASDGGGTSDAKADTGGGNDGGACSATTTCPIIGSSTGVTFDNCATCDTCMATSCCTQTTACFTKEADGGPSDCENLVDCIQACQNADGGTGCESACQQAHPTGLTAAQDLNDCLNTSCSGADGGTAQCN